MATRRKADDEARSETCRPVESNVLKRELVITVILIKDKKQYKVNQLWRNCDIGSVDYDTKAFDSGLQNLIAYWERTGLDMKTLRITIRKKLPPIIDLNT